MTSYSSISPEDVQDILTRLGELAQKDGLELRLRLTGGTLMMLEFRTRTAGTRDVDVLQASHEEKIIEYGAIIAKERGLPDLAQHERAEV